MASNTVITNAFLFDGNSVSAEPMNVTVSGSRIVDIVESSLAGEPPSDVNVIQAAGCTLLPGLIDSHVHVDSPESLDSLAAAGVTTALDMACFPASMLASLRQSSLQVGPASRPRPTMLSAGIPATGPGSLHSSIPGFPAEAILDSPDDVDKWVADRVAEGSDYIKMVCDEPGPSQAVIDALAAAARGAGKKSVAHAAYLEPFNMAIKCGADCLTHAPMDAAIPSEWATRLKQENRVVVPTLTMEEVICKGTHGNPFGDHPGAAKTRDFANALESVRVLHRAGVRLLAGTDANSTPFAPVRHGESLVRELELLVEAGFTPIEALRAATSLPAQYWRLADRGRVETGLRADLVLVEGEPWKDVGALRGVRMVVIGGASFGEV